VEELESKLNSILNNPDSMAQILSMAQALSGGMEGGTAQENAPETNSAAPTDTDMAGALAALSRMAESAGTDRKKEALLRALEPYVDDGRLRRARRALRLLAMAKLARSALAAHGGDGPV